MTPLVFTQVCENCNADLVLDFVEKDHSDNYPFDGTGGVLAHGKF